MHNVHENWKLISLIHPVAVTTTATDTAIDVEEYLHDGGVILDIGAVTGTTPTLDIEIEKTEDGTTWTTALTFTQVTTGDKVAMGRVELGGAQQIRVKKTVGGTTPSFTISMTLLAEVSEGGATVNSVTAT